MKDIILESLNKIREIESRQIISEALTPEEQKELDALAKELEPHMGRSPEVDALLLQHQKVASGGQAAQPAKAGTPAMDPEKLKAYQTKLGVTADGKMGPETKAAIQKFQKDNGLAVDGIIGPQTSAALDKQPAAGQAAQPAGQAAQPAAGAKGPDAIPANADEKTPYSVGGTRYDWKTTGGGRGQPATGSWQVTATPDDKLQWNATRARSSSGFTGADDEFKGTQTAKAPAAQPAGQTAQPAGQAAQPAQSAPAGTKTTSSTQVSGTLKMGKPEGPIQYNGKTVNPGDPAYAAASQALIQSQQKAQQSRSDWKSKSTASTAPVQQGATNADRRDM